MKDGSVLISKKSEILHEIIEIVCMICKLLMDLGCCRLTNPTETADLFLNHLIDESCVITLEHEIECDWILNTAIFPINVVHTSAARLL